MPLNWKEFSGADAFKSLKPEEQDAARLRFFDDQVAPRFAPEKRDGALAEFNRRTMTPATVAKPAVAPALIQRPEANVAARAEAPAPQQAAMPVRPVRPGQVQPAAAQPVVSQPAVEQPSMLAAAAPPEGFRARRPSTMPTDMASTRPEDQNDWQITKGLKAGVAQTKALGHGLKALAGDTLGLKDWERDGMSGYKREMEEAALHPGRVQKIEDINGLGDAVDWALYGVGTQIPTLASMVVTGGAAGAAYGLAAKGLTKKVAASLIEKNAAKLIAAGTARNAAYQAATKAVHATAAGVVGSVAGGAALEMPSIYGDTYDFDKSEGNAGVAATFGAVAGALEAIPGVAILKRMGLGKMATEEIAQGLLKDRTLGAVIDGMVREGATEGLQTIIERAAGAWVDENKEIFSSEGWSEIKNAMALGAMFGGGIEGGTQFIQNRMKTKPVQPGAQPGQQPPADEMPSEEARNAAFGEADVPRGTEIPPEAFAQPQGPEATDTLATDENGDIIIEDGEQAVTTGVPATATGVDPATTGVQPAAPDTAPGVAPPTEQPAAVAPPVEQPITDAAAAAPPAESPDAPLAPEARKQHMTAIGANLKVLRAERDAAKQAGDEALMAEVDDEIQATAVNFKRLANNQPPLPTPREQAAAPAPPAAALPKNDGIDLADEPPVKALDDARMQDPDFRNWMEQAVGGLVSVKEGNLGLAVDPNFIKGESDRGDETRMIRAGSVNPPWFQEIAAAENVSVDGLRGIVKKAMTGAKLGVRQDRAVRRLMDAITDERIGELEDWGRGLGMSAEEVSALHNDDPVAHMRALEAEVSARQKKAADAEVEQQWAEQDAVVAGKKPFTPDVVLGEDAGDLEGVDFSDQEKIESHVYATAAGWGVPVAQLDELHAQAPDAESFLSSVRTAIREIRANEKIRSDQGEAGSLADTGGQGTPESGESATAEAERLAAIEQARAEAIPALEEYLGTDWRKDNERRARLAAASPDELVEEVYRDKMTGLLNKRAWNEDVVKAGFEKEGRRSKPSAIVYIDLDGLKFLNDEMGHAAGDELLANFGEAMKAAGIDGYHISGDEFGAIFENEADASEAMDRLQWEVESSVVRGKSKDGRGITNTGIAFSYGLGGSANSADMAMQDNKKAREAQGLRGGARGGMPSTAAYDEASVLQPYNQADIDAKAAKDAARAKKEAGAAAKQKADDERGDFVLAGSARPADQAAARGAQDMFSGGAPAAPAAPKAKPSANTVFTEDAAEKARAVLRAKLGQVSTGIDPEIVQAGITLAGYHIEKGARSFSAYAKAMLEDMGEIVRPYLKSWYVAVKLDPRATGLDGMDSLGAVETVDVDAIGKEGPKLVVSNEGPDPIRQGVEAKVKAGELNPFASEDLAFGARPLTSGEWAFVLRHLDMTDVRNGGARGEIIDRAKEAGIAREDGSLNVGALTKNQRKALVAAAENLPAEQLEYMKLAQEIRGAFKPDLSVVNPDGSISGELVFPLPKWAENNRRVEVWKVDEEISKARGIDPFDAETIAYHKDPEGAYHQVELSEDAFNRENGKLLSRIRNASPAALFSNWITANRTANTIAAWRKEYPEQAAEYDKRQADLRQIAVGGRVQTPLADDRYGRAEYIIKKKNKVTWTVEDPTDGSTRNIRPAALRPATDAINTAAHEAATSPQNDLAHPTEAEASAILPGKIAAKDDAGLNKTPGDSVLAASELFGNDADAEAIRVKGFDSLDIERQHMVLSKMIAALDNQKILDAIIKSVPVDVMNRLVGGKLSPDSLLYNKTMLANRLSVSRDSSIPESVSGFIDSLSTKIESSLAGNTAEEVGLGPLGTPSPKRQPAISAGKDGRLDAGPTAKMPAELTSDLGGASLKSSAAGIANKVDDGHVEITVNGQTDTVNVTATDAQKEAGVYKKAHVTWNGLDITIENPAGSKRRPEWPTLAAHYGYLKRTEGADGDHVDVFINPDENRADTVFVIDQLNGGKAGAGFDEHKVMLGFKDKGAAIAAYKANYTKGWHVGPVTEMSVDEFKSWLKDGDTTKSVAAESPAAPAEADPLASTGDVAFDKLLQNRTIRYAMSRATMRENRGEYNGVPTVTRTWSAKVKLRGRSERDALPASKVLNRTLPDPLGDQTIATITVRMGAHVGDALNAEIWVTRTEFDYQGGKSEAAARQPAAEPKPAGKVADFGERIEGAAKYRDRYAKQMEDALEADIAAVPLSESWPEPDYEKMLEEGADPGVVAFVHAARDEIPVKPKKQWKLKGWTQAVQLLRDMSNGLVNGTIPADTFRETLAKPEFMRVARDVGGRADLYQAVGHGVSLKGVTLKARHYAKGQPDRTFKDVRDWAVEREAKASAFGNWPKELGVGNTRDEAIAAFKNWHAEMAGAEKPDAQTSFEIYRYRADPGTVVIGKKIGKDRVDLAKFPSVAEARAYLKNNHDDLVAKLDAYKKIPRERRLTNEPRVGVNHRNGGNVTAEQFQEAFGFRGGQFGSSLLSSQKEAQAHLNEAYDALMDMAGVLGIQPKALSLNGELALAFGARGHGGKDAPSAHYERDTKGVVTDDTVVINLTRKRGAGSLAHEWFHGLDNYFARARKERGGMLTEKPFPRGEGVRPEMVEAFKNLMDTIKRTSLEQRSAALDKRRSKVYWSTGLEMAARSFESYVIEKLRDQGASNDYLANIVSPEYWAAEEALRDFSQTGNMGEQQEQTYPYPTAAEVPEIRAAFDHFFETVETKETDKGVAIQEGEGVYSVESRGKKYGDRASQPIDDLFGLFGDPYENAEQRPGTTEKQRDLGRDALRDLSRRIGLDSVARRFNAGGSTPSILGAGLVRNFVAGQPNSLIGGTIQSPRDLAALAQVYRDPRFETFRVVYMKGDKVVGEAGYSSRMPGIVDMGNGFIADVSNDMARFGADGYYAMHNHPSGKSAPSTADANLTILLDRKVPGFLGHVVIDHNEYSVLDASGWHKTIQDDKLGSADFRADPVVQSDLLGAEVKGPRDVVDLAKRVQKPDMATVVMTVAGETGRVNLVVDLPADALRSHAPRMGALIRRMARGSGSGGNRFLVLPDGYPKAAFQHLITYGVFTDVVGADGTSSVEETPDLYDVFRRRDVLTKGLKGARVYEPEALYSRAAPTTGHTEATLYEQLRGLFGAKFMDRLFQSGRFRIITGKDAASILGMADSDALRSGGAVRGFYHRGNGITYLVADSIPAGFTDAQLKGLMRHEIGVHALKAGRDSAGWQGILDEIDRLIDSGDKAAHAAFLRAGAAGTRDVDLLEEVAGYLVEDAPDASITRRIIAWLKEQVFKLTGMQLKLTDADVVAMAQSALRAAPSALSARDSASTVSQPARSSAAPVWVSTLKQRIAEQGAKTRTGNDWNAWLQGNAAKLGIKKDELAATGILDWLSGALPESANLQGVRDSILGHANRLRDFVETGAFRAHGLGGFDVPTQSAVLNQVFTAAQNPEIFNAIVGAIPVEVMDILVARKLSPERFLHDKTVYQELLSAPFGPDVPITMKVASALVNSIARKAAKTVSSRPNMDGELVNRGSANGTIDDRHDVTSEPGDVVLGAGAVDATPVPLILNPARSHINAAQIISFLENPDRMREIAGRGMAMFSRMQLDAQAILAQWTRKLGLMRHAKNQDFDVTVMAPLVLRELGILKTVSLTKKRLGAIRSDHPDLPSEAITELPVLLADPRVVYTRREGESTAVIEVVTSKGEPVLVGMRDGSIRTITPKHTNAVATGDERLADEIGRSKIIYARNEKALAEAKAFEPPQAGTIPNEQAVMRARGQGSSTRILMRADLVKKYGRSDNGPLFSRAQNPVQGTMVPPAQPPIPPQQGTLNVQGGATGPGAQWASTPTTPLGAFVDTMLYRYQDKHIDLKRTQQGIKAAGRQISEASDAYLKEELFHGRAATRAKEFLEDELDPLIADMRARGVSQEDLGRFLWARHAKEANEHIAKINPELPDGGSGMLTQEAQDYLDALTPQQQADFAALAARVDAITQITRNALVNDKLISAQQRQDWESAYQHYVPLFRELEGNDTADLMTQGAGTGQGYSIKGAESKRRTGSQLPVADILGNLANARDKAIVRGEKARVGRALYALALTNKNPDFWRTAVTAPTIKTHDKNGMVIEIPDPMFKQRDNVVVVKVPTRKGNIVERAIVFNERDPRALRMAHAIKNLDGQQLGEFLGATASVTRYFASINTQYNPIFGVVNLIRDVQTAMLNLSSTPLAGKQAAVAADVARIVGGAMKHGMRDFDGPWKAIAREFEEAGGMTGYRDMFRTGQERTEAIEKALDPNWWQKRPWGKALTANGYLKAPAELLADKGVRPVMEWLSDYNQVLENATRLAAYKQARDMGLSRDASASIAKNLTVNFNRKGEMALQLGALYAFFNAAVQGIARMGQAFTGPAGKYIIGGGVLVGAMQAMLLAAAGYDDEEPPQFVRERAIILPTPWNKDRYVSIPMPLGFHVLPNFGRLIVEAVRTGDVMGKTASMMGIMADAFNPLGGSAPVAQILSPTATDPFVALGMNKDWTGKPIAREDFSNLHPTPGFSRARDAAGAPARWLAKALNRLSGGTDYTQGLVSPTPDQIEYLAGQLTGGIGREAIKASTTATSIVTGDELPMHKVPLIGRFYGSTEGQAPQANRFYNNLKRLNEHGATVKGLREDRRNAEVMAYLRDNPDARLYEAAGKAERKVSELRAKRRAMVEADAGKAELKRVDDLITAQMVQLNERMKALSK